MTIHIMLEVVNIVSESAGKCAKLFVANSIYIYVCVLYTYTHLCIFMYMCGTLPIMTVGIWLAQSCKFNKFTL